MTVSVYDDTGEIVLQYDLVDGDSVVVPAGGGYIEDRIDGEKFYVTGGVVTARPSIVDETDYFLDADGTSTISIALPAGTTVNHEGQTYTFASADNLVVRTSIMGVWTFEIIPPFPYIQVEVSVTALAV